MRIFGAGLAVITLAAASLFGHADTRIPNAHGNCAMPMSGFFRMADLDKNGGINRAEWTKMFNLIDQNHDGRLDTREVVAFEQNGMAMTQQMLLRDSHSRPAAQLQ